ncbi:uncharacterized protein PHACADRAFT_201128 [Phanerochaete carnosa HHB-10118-sp]|uniref:DUF6533 domain-containing protein n=1 Tax=Phanerochaete carnosa (strain HHB-10118-sp) TaxID=650164 RepID=K5VU47_PHACS|nr:uncharacterized protein PHACADRAFT_201128 [Phanerochaete carnosa HHB-10118-sp]EKM50290.1 hypothetical protein PHACADRAFT_201128 [Phanerochaete carnosa HHB-10118-sp]
MSAQLDQALVQAYSRIVTSYYIAVASSCLAVYEFLITFSNEIEIVWRRPITVRAVLLGSVRWCMLLATVTNLAPANSVTMLTTGLYGASDPVLGIRPHAISPRRTMVPFATNMYNAVMTKYGLDVDPLFGTMCIDGSRLSAQTYNIIIILQYRLFYITRGSLILADAIVLILTWIKTFRHWMNARRLTMKTSLTTCLLRDGTVYFVALLALNMTQLLTLNFSDTEMGLLSTLITTMPPILISRFIINLRTAGSTMSDHPMHMSGQQQGQSAPQFRMPAGRLGDMGGTLRDGWGDELCDEESGVAEAGEEGRHEASAEA